MLPDEREFVVVTEEEKQEEEKEGKPFELHMYMYVHVHVFPTDHVDLSVRKRRAPDSDDLTLQNTAKRAKDNSVIAQEL